MNQSGLKMLRWIARMLLVVMLALAVFAYAAYWRDIRVARVRVVSGASILQTRCGPVEYATLGAGPPVLVLHGSSGGWDQGIAGARGLVSHGFRLIAPSRFGYLRTPLPPDASPQAEADTWACFLDALRIPRLPVITFSAGTAPTIQLALRHPDRVSAMVLIVPAGGGLIAERQAGPPGVLLDALYRFDFPLWMVMQVAPRVMYTLVGVPASLVPSLSPEDRAALDETVSNILPPSRRRLGVLNEGRTQEAGVQFPLEKVTTPTLLISAADDLYKTLPVARHAAGIIPTARLIAFETGGHLLLGRGDEVWPAVADFIKQ